MMLKRSVKHPGKGISLLVIKQSDIEAHICL